MSRFVGRLIRKKYIDLSTVSETKLARCLSTFDLTALGIGSTLGAGIYVVAGQVAKQSAGPSVVLAFFVAAVASVLAGLCYAEFGARVPKTGSAYVYSYVTVGELWAFIIGWNLILEYVIGTASVARAWSAYFDSIIDYKISTYLNSTVHMDVAWLSSYPDFFAFAITILLSIILAIGVKESSTFNNIFTGVNLLVVTYVVICGMFKADFHNWNIPKNEIPNGTDPKYPTGDGGFFPFGFSGMMSGAATCFYAFVGFDAIATTGEEVRNPQKAIPISIVISLLACFLAYFGVSAVLTLMVPYYILDPNAPLPEVFKRVGWGFAKYVVSVGAVCGLSTSLLGAMFPLPRVIYAMASDGLLFRFLARVNERFKTPLIATLISGLFAGTMAMLFDLKELVDMMSIGTLLAYTLVAICVLILRYEPPDPNQKFDDVTHEEDHNGVQNIVSDYGDEYVPAADPSCCSPLTKCFNPPEKAPTEQTAHLVKICVVVISLVAPSLSAVLIFAEHEVSSMTVWAIVLVTVFALILVFSLAIIVRQPQCKTKIPFKVPFLPFLPFISIFVNTYLMLKLSSQTWIRFAIWMVLGMLIYFCYGIWHSNIETERPPSKLRNGHFNQEDVDENTPGDAIVASQQSKDTERTSLIKN
ncbi:unnamed protein product [Owenia fusiformis]|uniref:Uncharacterized protein n=1 Tax=Owenia fusiformis TaxID=6347 RepID=A0A8J1YAA9_OWEFU|nr:unnamed protein product [Owenia fusiformis]